MSYSGSGISVTVTDGAGNTNTADVLWSELDVDENSTTWIWNVPDNFTNMLNGQVTYKIIYTTTVDMDGAATKVSAGNTAETGIGAKGEGGIGIEPDPDGKLDFTKKIVKSKSDVSQVTWTLTIKVPKQSVNEAVLTDTYPVMDSGNYTEGYWDSVNNVWVEGSSEYWKDTLDSYTISGLANGESYEESTDEEGKLILTFYKTDGETVTDDNGNLFTCIIDGGESAQEIEIDPETDQVDGAVNLNNVYVTIPGGYAYLGSISVQKKVLDGEKLYDTEEVFYAGVFSDKDQESADVVDGSHLVVQLENNGDAVSLPVPVNPDGTFKTFYVFETDEDGKKIDKSSFKYMVTGEGAVTLGFDNAFMGSVVLTNTLIAATPTPTVTRGVVSGASGSSNPGRDGSHLHEKEKEFMIDYGI